MVRLPAEGRIAVLHPPAGYDLSCLPRDRLTVAQPFRPDHDAALTRGYQALVEAEGHFEAVIVVVPRAKEAARALVAAGRELTGGPVVVDGQKTDGVDSLLRECRARGTVGEVLSKAHGKIFQIDGGDFAAWRAETRQVAGFAIPPGGFSAAGPDPGSVALARALPAALGRSVADLGAGWGFLSATILERAAVEVLHLVEADRRALDCARSNVTDPRARFHWADARSFRPPEPLDAVVTNPPFHSARRADPSLGRAFIAAAAGMLKPSGALWLVANRHLPYEGTLREAFGDVREAAGDGAYKIIHAARPRRPMR